MILIASPTCGQKQSVEYTELQAYIETVKIIVSADEIGCTPITNSNEENKKQIVQSKKAVRLFEEYKLFDEIHSYSGFYSQSIDSLIQKKGVDSNKVIRIQLNYRPPNHFETICIVIYDQYKALEIIKQLISIANPDGCLDRILTLFKS